MNCRRVSDEDVAERYLLGQLDEADQEAFERHFFECDACFAQLETLRAVQERLERDQESVPGLALRPRPSMRWWWAVVFAAVVTVIAVALICWAIK